MLEVYFVQWAIGLNPYNYLQECFGGAISLHDDKSLVFPDGALIHGPRFNDYMKVTCFEATKSGQYAIIGNIGVTGMLQRYRSAVKSNPSLRSSIPCTDTSDRETYLNNPEVREALHVPEFVQPWEACRCMTQPSHT